GPGNPSPAGGIRLLGLPVLPGGFRRYSREGSSGGAPALRIHNPRSPSGRKIGDIVNVAILGTGYVGLTTGVCLAYLGHQVTCVDPDANKTGALQRGEVPFYEPHLEDLLAEARPNLRFTMDYAEAVPDAQVV